MKTAGKKSKRFGTLSDYIAFTVALIAAFMLWIYAIGFDSTVFTRTVDDVQVKVVGATELAQKNGFTLRSEPDFTVSVTISGKRANINAVKNSDITAVVDISGVADAGNSTLPITVTVPNGTTLTAQSEAEATLFLDKYITVSVPVVPMHTISSIAAGVRLGSEICNPSAITVSGPESELAKIECAYASYSVIELKDNFVAYCSPQLIDKDGKSVNNPYINADAQDIVVNLSVYKQKTVPLKAVFTGGLYDTSVATVIIEPTTLTVKGPVAVIDALDALTVELDETAFAGSYSTEVIA